MNLDYATLIQLLGALGYQNRNEGGSFLDSLLKGQEAGGYAPDMAAYAPQNQSRMGGQEPAYVSSYPGQSANPLADLGYVNTYPSLYPGSRGNEGNWSGAMGGPNGIVGSGSGGGGTVSYGGSGGYGGAAGTTNGGGSMGGAAFGNRPGQNIGTKAIAPRGAVYGRPQKLGTTAIGGRPTGGSATVGYNANPYKPIGVGGASPMPRGGLPGNNSGSGVSPMPRGGLGANGGSSSASSGFAGVSRMVY